MQPPDTARPAALAAGGSREDDLAGGLIFPSNATDEFRAQHRALPDPDDETILALLAAGISDDALCLPSPIRGARVRFDRTSFAFDHEAESAVILRAEDRGEVIDLIAWQPKTGRLATWLGRAFCLGDADDIFNPASYFDGDALKVHRSPLEWLLDRDGIVIVQPELSYAYLRHCRRLQFADPVHARRVRQWCQPPKPRTEFLVEVSAERRAA